MKVLFVMDANLFQVEVVDHSFVKLFYDNEPVLIQTFDYSFSFWYVRLLLLVTKIHITKKIKQQLSEKHTIFIGNCGHLVTHNFRGIHNWDLVRDIFKFQDCLDKSIQECESGWL